MPLLSFPLPLPPIRFHALLSKVLRRVFTSNLIRCGAHQKPNQQISSLPARQLRGRAGPELGEHSTAVTTINIAWKYSSTSTSRVPLWRACTYVHTINILRGGADGVTSLASSRHNLSFRSSKFEIRPRSFVRRESTVSTVSTVCHVCRSSSSSSSSSLGTFLCRLWVSNCCAVWCYIGVSF